MNVTHRCRIEAPVEKVAEALVSEAYNLEAERGREGVVSTAWREIERNEHKVVFELRTTEYQRTKTGGLDKSGTFVSITTSDLDRARNVLTWTWRKESGVSRLKLSGTYRLRADGASTSLEHEVQIEVNIPLIGGQIAKVAAKAFETGLTRYDDILRRHARA